MAQKNWNREGPIAHQIAWAQTEDLAMRSSTDNRAMYVSAVFLVTALSCTTLMFLTVAAVTSQPGWLAMLAQESWAPAALAAVLVVGASSWYLTVPKPRWTAARRWIAVGTLLAANGVLLMGELAIGEFSFYTIVYRGCCLVVLWFLLKGSVAE